VLLIGGDVVVEKRLLKAAYSYILISERGVIYTLRRVILVKS
jgi:hypothetical protein